MMTLKNKKEDIVRCGLCNIKVQNESFEEHTRSKQHRDNLLRFAFEPAKPTKVPVKTISASERRQNIKNSVVAQAKNFGYYSLPNGRSYYRMRCECLQFSDVFAWRGCKRCSNCGKLLHIPLSFRENQK